MREAWNRVEDWLRTEFPVGLENLGEPINGSEIRALNETLETLPTDLKDLLAIHNGEQPNEIWLMGHWSLLPSQHIGNVWREQVSAHQGRDVGARSSWWNPTSWTAPLCAATWTRNVCHCLELV